MSIFNPYGNNTPLIDIYRHRYNLFRLYILILGILSFVNSALVLLGKDFYIFYSAELPYFVAVQAESALQGGKTFLGILFCAISFLMSGFYAAVYFFSKKKYRFVSFAAILFGIDCIVVGVNIINARFECILGHILIIILFVWGIRTTKRLINAENEERNRD